MKQYKLLSLLSFFIIICFLCPPLSAQTEPTVFVRMAQYERQGDHLLLPITLESFALERGYHKLEDEGLAFNTQMPGTVPLRLFYSSKRNEFFSTATLQGAKDATDVGYTFDRDLAYVFSANPSEFDFQNLEGEWPYNVMPLTSYYTEKLPLYFPGLYFPLYKKDNYTTLKATVPADYFFKVRVEGYLLNSSYIPDPLYLYQHATTSDFVSTSLAALLPPPIPDGYKMVGNPNEHEGCVWYLPMPGTAPLKLYWNQDRGDALTTGTPESETEAIADGYSFVKTVGYIYTEEKPGLIPLPSARNKQTQASFAAAPWTLFEHGLSGDYAFVRYEGYMFPPNSCTQFIEGP